MASGGAEPTRPAAGALARLAGHLTYRARHWAHFLALPLLGFEPARAWEAQLLPLGRGVAVAFLLLSFGYLINGFTEARVQGSPAKALALRSEGDRRMVAILLWALPLAALALGLTGPAIVWLSAAACALSGLLYSAGPCLKSWPVVGTAANLTNFMPLMFLGLDDFAALASRWPLVAAFGCLLLENQLLHEAADQQEDALAGRRTTFLWLGRRAAALLCAGLGAGLAAAVLALPGGPAPWVAAACLAVFGLGVPWGLLGAGRAPARAARLRLLHRGLSLAAGSALYLLFILGRA